MTMIDGERIGATDATFGTDPGAHVVIVEQPAAGQRLSGPVSFDDSARPGVGCAIAGAALVVGGAYWWMRRTRSRSAPTVSATSAGGTVGWITSLD